jgi:ATP-dependent helicase/nuclease subunit A
MFALFDMAAGAEIKPALKVKRLVSLEEIATRGKNVASAITNVPDEAGELVRPEGSRRARVVGNAVHALLRQLSTGQLSTGQLSTDQLSRGLDAASLEQRARSMLRAAAFSGKPLEEAMQEVLGAIENCRKDAVGRWILEARVGAQSETSWTSWVGEEMVTLRADRVFRGGTAPMEPGVEFLWIIDYKMSTPAGEAVEEFLVKQRGYYAPQLERYAEALKVLEGGPVPVRMGLYYPRIGQLDWW